MPDRRQHRGPHPEDGRLFAPVVWPVLRVATDDLCWMLSRGYAQKSSLKLVGDRYGLVARQRTAVGRCACSDAQAARRGRHRVDTGQLAGRTLCVDGYNVLTSVEAAMAGAIILPGRDGTYRDMASMHGSFRRVAETLPALERIGQVVAEVDVAECLWYLDRPVSNSGRLKVMIQETAAGHGWPWRVELVPDPDPLLAATEQVVATADSAILDACGAWCNLARETITRHVPGATVLDIGPEDGGPADMAVG